MLATRLSLLRSFGSFVVGSGRALAHVGVSPLRLVRRGRDVTIFRDHASSKLEISIDMTTIPCYDASGARLAKLHDRSDADLHDVPDARSS